MRQDLNLFIHFPKTKSWYYLKIRITYSICTQVKNKNQEAARSTVPLQHLLAPLTHNATCAYVEASWNVMAHAQKPDFVFRRNGRVHLNRRGRQFSRRLAAEVCASAVVMLDTPCSEVVWGVLTNHSIHQFPLHVPSRASPCAITFQLESTTYTDTPSTVPHCLCMTCDSESEKHTLL